MLCGAGKPSMGWWVISGWCKEGETCSTETMWRIPMKEPHVGFFSVRSERRSAQSYLRSGTGLLLQSRRALHETAAAGVLFGKVMKRRGAPVSFRCHVTMRRSNGPWRWTSQDWNVYLRRQRRRKNSLVVSNTGLYVPPFFFFSGSDELRKTRIVLNTPTQKNHAPVRVPALLNMFLFYISLYFECRNLYKYIYVLFFHLFIWCVNKRLEFPADLLKKVTLTTFVTFVCIMFLFCSISFWLSSPITPPPPHLPSEHTVPGFF